MSEYQYYEFQAVDRPLTPEEQDKVASLSSRVQLTASSAVFTYNFGDFRGNPERILEAYYDAMLYLANWGSKQLLFRLPRKLVQLADLQPYCVEDVVSTRQSGDYAILNIRVDEEEPDGWTEGEGCLAPLLPIRQMLLEGDFRALYLAWLKGAQRTDPDGEEAEALEPPVPPNLKKLTPPLRALVEFFDVDPDLIAVAAGTSPTQPEAGPVDYPALLPKLSPTEREQFLVRLAKGESNLTTQLQKRLLELSHEKAPLPPPSAAPRRSIRSLLAAAEEHCERREINERIAARKARAKRLQELAVREPELWREVVMQIEQRKPKAYGVAIKLLQQLKELNEFLGHIETFQVRLAELRNQYNSLSSFKSRLKAAGL